MSAESISNQNKRLFREETDIVKLAQTRDPKLLVAPIMGSYFSWRFDEAMVVRTFSSLIVSKQIDDLGGIGNHLATLYYLPPDSQYYPDLYSKRSRVRTRFRLKVGQLTDELTVGIVEQITILDQLKKGAGTGYTSSSYDSTLNDTKYVDSTYMISPRKMRKIVSFPRSIPDTRSDFNPSFHLKHMVIDPNPGDYELAALVLARLKEAVTIPPSQNWQYLEAIMRDKYGNF